MKSVHLQLTLILVIATACSSILSIHGGGFTSRSKSALPPYIPYAARLGFAFLIPLQSFGGIRL
jgi:hypothetical protein